MKKLVKEKIVFILKSLMFKKLFKEKKFFYLILPSFLLFVIAIILLIINASQFTYPTIIHFTSLKGVDFLGDINDLWGISLLVFFFLLVNTFFAFQFSPKDKLTSYIFLSFNVLLALVFFIFMLIVLYNN